MTVPFGRMFTLDPRTCDQQAGGVTHTDYRNPVQVYRRYTFRAYPTRPQEGRSAQLMRDHCDLYDAALEERREAWRMRKTRVTCFDQILQLKAIRHTDPDGQGQHSFSAQMRTLQRLDAAFQAFYRRCKAGEKPGYPRFKSYARFNQVTFVNGNGARWTPADEDGWARAYFKAVGSVKIRQHRPVNGTIKTLALKRECRRWYVIVVVNTEAVPLPATGRAVGVDVGVAQFLTTSDGEIVGNPRFLAATQAIITDLQRHKARAKRGSGNCKRLRRALAKEYRKIRHRRRDFHHKTARALVSTCDVIALEELNTAGMTRRPKPKSDGAGGYLPNGAAAKSGLNKSILDAGWAQFAGILAAKAEEAGRRVVLVNPAYTSIDCHQCGRRCERPRQDTVICPEHGAMDADMNGAINIATRAGLGSGQAAA